MMMGPSEDLADASRQTSCSRTFVLNPGDVHVSHVCIGRLGARAVELVVIADAVLESAPGYRTAKERVGAFFVVIDDVGIYTKQEGR